MKKILVLGLIALLMIGGLTLIGCGKSLNCPGLLDDCNAAVYCGETGCDGYFGGSCDC